MRGKKVEKKKKKKMVKMRGHMAIECNLTKLSEDIK